MNNLTEGYSGGNLKGPERSEKICNPFPARAVFGSCKSLSGKIFHETPYGNFEGMLKPVAVRFYGFEIKLKYMFQF